MDLVLKHRKENEWQDVAYVQLKDSYILYKQEYLEFDTLSTELKTNEQIADENHWQDVRERAAIAAMQGMLANSNSYIHLADGDTYPKVAVRYADALIEELKKK